jgi:hypothetical protein
MCSGAALTLDRDDLVRVVDRLQAALAIAA